MLLFLDKPVWCTSFDVVKKCKKIRKGEKIGHSWTLDPLASGLLIVAVGKSTKLLHWLIWKDKSYTTTIDFSKRSDTRDMQARSRSAEITKEWTNRSTLSKKDQDIAKKRWRNNFETQRTIPTIKQIQLFCDSLLWVHDIPLTPFSAKKVDGKKLYEYARKGDPIHKSVPMNVLSYEIIDYSFPQLTISFSVGSGTYIRSLGQVIWNYFWRWWVLTSLRRTRIGKYSIDQLQ